MLVTLKSTLDNFRTRLFGISSVRDTIWTSQPISLGVKAMENRTQAIELIPSLALINNLAQLGEKTMRSFR